MSKARIKKIIRTAIEDKMSLKDLLNAIGSSKPLSKENVEEIIDRKNDQQLSDLFANVPKEDLFAYGKMKEPTEKGFLSFKKINMIYRSRQNDKNNYT